MVLDANNILPCFVVDPSAAGYLFPRSPESTLKVSQQQLDVERGYGLFARNAPFEDWYSSYLQRPNESADVKSNNLETKSDEELPLVCISGAQCLHF